MSTLSVLIGTVITIVVVLPWFVVVVMPVMVCYYNVQVGGACVGACLEFCLLDPPRILRKKVADEMSSAVSSSGAEFRRAWHSSAHA